MPFHPRAAKSYPKPLYFSNLIDLDEHLDKNPKRWDVLGYTSRSEIAVQAASSKGRLLVSSCLEILQTYDSTNLYDHQRHVMTIRWPVINVAGGFIARANELVRLLGWLYRVSY